MDLISIELSGYWTVNCLNILKLIELAKHISINEKERDKFMIRDPVYLTSLVLEAKMKEVKSGSTKKKVFALMKKLMSFIELEFTHMMGHRDLRPLKKVLDFHRALERKSRVKICLG